MKDCILTTIIITILAMLASGCAYIEKSEYFSPKSNQGSAWTGYQGALYRSGGSDIVWYPLNNKNRLLVSSNRLGYTPYAFGPCLLIPLPIIPMFGFGSSSSENENLQVYITPHISDYQSPLYIAKVDLIYKDKILRPKRIKVVSKGFNCGGGECGPDWIRMEHLPIEISADQSSRFEYDLITSMIDKFQLKLDIESADKSPVIQDRILFERDESMEFGCAL